MKKIFKLFTLFLAVSLAFTVFSCKKDDDDDDSVTYNFTTANNSLFAGSTYTLTKLYQNGTDMSAYIGTGSDQFTCSFEFKTDDTAVYKETDDTKESTETGTFKTDTANSAIQMINDDGTNIITYSSDKTTLTWAFYDKDDKCNYKLILTKQ